MFTGSRFRAALSQHTGTLYRASNASNEPRFQNSALMNMFFLRSNSSATIASSSEATTSGTAESEHPMRLSKILAAAGVVPSRKASKHVVFAGRVEINGQPASSPADLVNATDEILLDGSLVHRFGTNLDGKQTGHHQAAPRSDLPRVRLSKLLSSIGAASSRRGGTEIVHGGRVTVNSETVFSPAAWIDANDEVRLDGRVLDTQGQCGGARKGAERGPVPDWPDKKENVTTPLTESRPTSKPLYMAYKLRGEFLHDREQDQGEIDSTPQFSLQARLKQMGIPGSPRAVVSALEPMGALSRLVISPLQCGQRRQTPWRVHLCSYTFPCMHSHACTSFSRPHHPHHC